VSLTAAVSGSLPLAWQWQENGTNLLNGGNLSGAATRILTLTNLTTANSGTYALIVSNSAGWLRSTSAVLQVVSSAPFITIQPAGQTLSPGANATFTVSAQGNLPLSYQWQFNGSNLVNGGVFSGVTTDTLGLSRATELDNGNYSVIVSNTAGSISSSNALLAVIPVSAPGTRLATLHWFSGGLDGSGPSGLALGLDGRLYGTTQTGGTNGSSGTVFRVDTNGAVDTFASFSPATGSSPCGGLVTNTDGCFYGTTRLGGANSLGNVFRMSPGGALTNLYSFTGGADGSFPVAPLLAAANGNLYGPTATGGSLGAGNIFRLAPAGAFTNLYSFTNGADGNAPASALAQGADGNFYGMTGGGAHGCGNVFRMTPAGALANLYSFTGGTDGYAPAGALTQGPDGNFYGATTHNTLRGIQFYGTLFKITTNGALTTLYMLNYTDGFYPYAGLVLGANGNFYGTTYSGGASNCGTVFTITPAGALTNLLSFDGFDGGSQPQAAPAFGSDNSLYGTTTSGGPGNLGTVFRLSFAPAINAQPADLTLFEGANATFTVGLFGTTPLFCQWQQNGTNLTDGPNVSGANASTLTLSHVTGANAGAYSVIVSNALGSVTSATAQLTVIPAPAFQSVHQTNGTVTLTCSAYTGQKYQLQFTPTLASTNWTNLGPVLTAGSTVLTTSDAIDANTQRFYRLVLLPQ
jgi:uncharacterized repeat protein (TIGR03803 family)